MISDMYPITPLDGTPLIFLRVKTSFNYLEKLCCFCLSQKSASLFSSIDFEVGVAKVCIHFLIPGLAFPESNTVYTIEFDLAKLATVWITLVTHDLEIEYAGRRSTITFKL